MRDEYDFSKGKRSPYTERVKPETRAQAAGIARFLDELEQEAGPIDKQVVEEIRHAWPAPGLEGEC